jgi:hypothetical protein
MGKLFEYRNVIEDKVKAMGQDAFKVKGKIGLRSGVVIGLIQSSTPDDPEQIRALGAAIREILGVNV